MTDYLVNTRGIDAERFKTIYAGRYKEWQEVAAELWIAPHGAAPPEPVRYNPKIEPFTGMFEEFESFDTRFYVDDAGTGPPFRSSKRAAFAELLRQQTGTRAFIVAYNTKGAIPGAWRRAAKDVADGLQHGYKIEAERIEIIYAGYRERAAKKEEDDETEGDAIVQLWILPKDAPPPATAAKEAEQRPSEAAHIGTFSDNMLTDSRTARRAFEGFADVLRSDEQLSACLIVRLRDKNAEENVEQSATPKPAADGPIETAKPNAAPELDLMALVEKWRADLVKDYGISEHRLVVMTGAAREWSDGDVETWVVPRGAALPDPNAVEEAAEDEQATATDQAQQDAETQKEF